MDYAPDRSADTTPILTAGPSISAREASYTLDAVRNGWNGGWNGYLERLRARRSREYVGVEHAIATSSCTGALHLALAALGIGPGDEVIVPDITWVATANAVSYVGATPVFADVERGLLVHRPGSRSRPRSRPRTKAVMPVHLYGHPARLDEIAAIARAHGLRIVEDAAPGDRRRVRPAAASARFGDVAALQLPGREAARHRRGRHARHGRPTSSTSAPTRSGTRAASPGDVLDPRDGLEVQDCRTCRPRSASARSSASTSSSRPSAASTAGTPRGSPGVDGHRAPARGAGRPRSIYWMSNIRVAPEAGLDREALRAALRAQGIDTRPVFPTISQYPMWPRRQAAAAGRDRRRRRRGSTCRAACACGATRSSGPAGRSGRPCTARPRLAA